MQMDAQRSECPQSREVLPSLRTAALRSVCRGVRVTGATGEWAAGTQAGRLG